MIKQKVYWKNPHRKEKLWNSQASSPLSLVYRSRDIEKVEMPEDIKEFVNKAFQSNDQDAMSYAEELIKQHDKEIK